MKEKYEELKQQILKSIEEIDKETPWQNIEPEWWLEMMELQKFVINLNSK